MHASAKLNLFFGVPNLGADLLPRHLAYLESFMARRPMNMFFPVSVTLSTVATTMLAARSLDAQTPFELVGYTMLATLMALAVLEHWFLVAPMNGNALWSVRPRAAPPAILPRRPGGGDRRARDPPEVEEHDLRRAQLVSARLPEIGETTARSPMFSS